MRDPHLALVTVYETRAQLCEKPNEPEPRPGGKRAQSPDDSVALAHSVNRTGESGDLLI
jgi:hypothetical protein